MNEMTLVIRGSGGEELLAVPFGPRHVVFAMRQAGVRGPVSEMQIAIYIAELVNRAGEDWKRQMVEWQRQRVAAEWGPERDLVAADAAARTALEEYLLGAAEGNEEQ